MKKLFSGLTIFAILFAFSVVAFAGGDQNKKRHDSTKGQGSTNTTRSQINR